MVLAITDNTTTGFDMEGTSDNGGTWTALGSAASLTANGDIFKVGTGSISCRLDGGASGAQGGMQITRGTAFDFDDSGTRRGMVAFWAQTTSELGSGGIRVIVGTDASNNHEWIASTPDGSTGIQYNGGWVRHVVDLSVTPDVTNGTMTATEWAAMGYFAIEFDIVTDIMGNIQTIYIDQLDVLTATDIAAGTRAFEVTGTTTTAGNALSELAGLATVTDLGALIKTGNESFSLNMPVKFGDDGTGNSTITSTNEYCFIPNHRFGNGFCAIEFDGGTGTNTATWGAESGSGDNTLGATGGAFRGVQDGTNGNFRIICDASDATTVLAGVIIDGADSISLTNTNVRLVSCTVVNSGSVTLDVGAGATMRDGTVTDSLAASGTGAVILVGDPGATADFRDMLIQNCVHAVENEANGPITRNIRNINFQNNTADVRHNGSGVLTWNNLENSNASTSSNGGGGSVSFVTAVDVIVTCVDDETGLVIPNVRVGAETTTGQNEVINELTSASGVADNIGYNLPADPTEIIIRCYDEGDAGQHAPVTRIVDVTGNGLDITIRMPNNPQYTPTT